MGNDWRDPEWVRQGRTGPNGPRYAKRKDRAKARKEYHASEPGGCPKMLAVLLLVMATGGGGIAYGVYLGLEGIL